MEEVKNKRVQKKKEVKNLVDVGSMKFDEKTINQLLQILIRYETDKENNKLKVEKDKLKKLNNIEKQKEKDEKNTLLNFNRETMDYVFDSKTFDDISEIDDNYIFISKNYPDIQELIDAYKIIDKAMCLPLQIKYKSLYDEIYPPYNFRKKFKTPEEEEDKED